LIAFLKNKKNRNDRNKLKLKGSNNVKRENMYLDVSLRGFRITISFSNLIDYIGPSKIDRFVFYQIMKDINESKKFLNSDKGYSMIKGIIN